MPAISVPRSATFSPWLSSNTILSCSAKMSPIRPSTLTVPRTSPVATSTKFAVMRTSSPIRWNPPTTTHVAPRRRPMSIASDSFRCASEPRLRSASKTRARPITVRPWMFFRSELTVSAMPVPIQSSAGSRVMLANVITATELSTRCRAATPIATRLVVPRGVLSIPRAISCDCRVVAAVVYSFSVLLLHIQLASNFSTPSRSSVAITSS